MNRTIAINPVGLNTSMAGTVSHAMHNSAAHLTAVLSEPSSPESSFDDSELFQHAMSDEVTAQLAAAGPIGVAAAAAIATGKKRKRPHAFETNPSIRKRQQTRLLRKLKSTIEEYTTRVGQQAIILTCTPGKANQTNQFYKVFGSQPLENIIKNCKSLIMTELEAQLATQMPQSQERENQHLHELPPLNIDGIPTPVDKMTQAQLRAFIPEMLKYSTGRSKPGWGKMEYRPVWWPDDVPWANVRSDVRTEEVKKKVSWTTALRTIVRNCYRHHGREDLLPEFQEEQPNQIGANAIQIPAQTMLQTISNPDGSVSIIQVETGDQTTPQIVTLADGSQAHIVHAQAVVPGIQTIQNAQGDTTQALAQVNNTQNQGVISSVDISNINQQATLNPGFTEATLNQDGQLVLTGDASGLSGVVSIPVSMYQTVVTNLPNLQQAHSLQVLPTTTTLQPPTSFPPPTNIHAPSLNPKQEEEESSHEDIEEGVGAESVEVVLTQEVDTHHEGS